MDREEGELRDLREAVCKKAKRNAERACKGGGFLTVLPTPQDGTDLSRKEFRSTFL